MTTAKGGELVLLVFLVLLRLRFRLQPHLLQLGVEVGLLVHLGQSWGPFIETLVRATYSGEELHEVEERHPHLRREELLGEDGVQRGGHPCDL